MTVDFFTQSRLFYIEYQFGNKNYSFNVTFPEWKQATQEEVLEHYYDKIINKILVQIEIEYLEGKTKEALIKQWTKFYPMGYPTP